MIRPPGPDNSVCLHSEFNFQSFADWADEGFGDDDVVEPNDIHLLISPAVRDVGFEREGVSHEAIGFSPVDAVPAALLDAVDPAEVPLSNQYFFTATALILSGLDGVLEASF